MSAYQLLDQHSTRAALAVAMVSLLVLALRIVQLPVALLAVLLARAVKRLNDVVAAVPTEPNTVRVYIPATV